MSITPQLWLKIIRDYIDPLDYLNLSQTHQVFRQYLIHPQINTYLSRYVEHQLTAYYIKEEEWDDRDDCGSSCLVYFLNNGMVIDSEDYDFIYQQQRDLYRHHFPWLLN